MSLFESLAAFRAGPLDHRIVLAPMTRQRGSDRGCAPTELAVEYYMQRATEGGLLISEGTLISPEALGYPQAPGIWTLEQVDGWSKVTAAVHEKGGYIFCQLWHVGRVSHPSWRDHRLCEGTGYTPCVSASNVPMPSSTKNTLDGTRRRNEAPRSLRPDEIPRLVQDYVKAAKNAMAAGFDGVEVHAAHGYLIDQFLNNGTNKRTDIYGGSIENRCRLLFEVVDAVVAAVGPGRCAVRLSPRYEGCLPYFAIEDSDPEPLYEHAVKGLNQWQLGYLLLTEARWLVKFDDAIEQDLGYKMEIRNAKKYRQLYNGILMSAGGLTPETATNLLQDGTVDLVAFGRFFLSNPDFVDRLRKGSDLNRYDRKTFYTHEHEGYTDYPSLDGSIGVPGKYRTISPQDIGSQAKL